MNEQFSFFSDANKPIDFIRQFIDFFLFVVFIGIFVYRKNKINFKLNKPNVTKGESLEKMHKIGKIFTCFLHKIFKYLEYLN